MIDLTPLRRATDPLPALPDEVEVSPALSVLVDLSAYSPLMSAQQVADALGLSVDAVRAHPTARPGER